MTDDKPRSALAEKALAHKAKREADAARTARIHQEHEERLQAVPALWVGLRSAIATVIEGLNTELAGTGTQVDLKWEDISRGTPNLLGAATITFKQDGARLHRPNLSIEVFKSGSGRVTDAVSQQSKKVSDFSIGDADREWVDRTVRAFVDRALD